MDNLMSEVHKRAEQSEMDPVLEVYLARACKTLENQGWEKFNSPKCHTVVCPGCGWTGGINKLKDGCCPVCDYVDGDHRLPTLEEMLQIDDNNWNDVAVGPFAKGICRALHINKILDLVYRIKESSGNPDFTFADLRILQVQACQTLRKIKGE
jgi:hypothetical protein